MRSRYSAADAAACRQQFAPWGEDLADRVYTSRLLGADPALVLHGGGNTSVKSHAFDLDGQSVDVLWVKGSGWDLGTIAPAGFAQCRLAPLRVYAQLPRMTDEQMVAGLRSQMLNPDGPTPSVEALLHAHLPGKFIDHTHADAVLTVVDQPDGAERAREVWGGDALFLPYVAPGFILARRIAELGVTPASPPLIVLGKHGIFAWGETAQESYERMIGAVDRAERYVAARTRPVGAAPGAADAERRRRAWAKLAPVLRGALARMPEGQRFVLERRDNPVLDELLTSPGAPEVVARGSITPDHALRTRAFPAWLPDAVELGESEPARARAAVEQALSTYAARYTAYFDAHSRQSNTPLTRLDAAPRVVVLPGLGAAAIGRTKPEANIVGDLYEHTARVMRDGSQLGAYQPVSHGELFEVEYWSLEQAKLKKAKSEGALAGKIALITGAASGIGLATAEHFLTLGAHVVLVDRALEALEAAAHALASRFPARVSQRAADVTKPDEVQAAVDHAAERFGGLDLAVSNAGDAPSAELHTDEGAALLEASLELNLLSHQHLAQAASRLMIAQGIGGCLLFNASKSAFNPGPKFGPYAVAKAGLVALMKQYAIDLARFGVRANAVNADRVRTSLFSEALLAERAKARGLSPQAYFKSNLLERETLASDVAQAFAYLALAEATTGAVVPVDGGNAAAFPR
jgi:rhamnose utilization protein RhaD (predicted bifunctional aldolase and dehydrogenase)/NAD(P)-dependent dehydrogenase (short-subunit alcohol dehydrogenase family)